jgi:hypothetical protein
VTTRFANNTRITRHIQSLVNYHHVVIRSASLAVVQYRPESSWLGSSCLWHVYCIDSVSRFSVQHTDSYTAHIYHLQHCHTQALVHQALAGTNAHHKAIVSRGLYMLHTRIDCSHTVVGILGATEPGTCCALACSVVTIFPSKSLIHERQTNLLDCVPGTGCFNAGP